MKMLPKFSKLLNKIIKLRKSIIESFMKMLFSTQKFQQETKMKYLPNKELKRILSQNKKIKI